MKKKNIKKYAATGILAATIISGLGLKIHDTNIDHTKEVCPITHIMNMIPNASSQRLNTNLPTGVALHQWSEMEKDYEEKGINDVQISYGKITEMVNETHYLRPIITEKDGSNIYFAPVGYYLTNDEEFVLRPICRQDIVSVRDVGYGLTANWGEVSYDDTNGFSYENEEVLKIK